MKFLIAVLVIVALSVSCTSFSGFVRFYKPYFDAHTVSDVILLAEKEEPKIYTSNNLNNDLIDVLSNRYLLVGVSNFNGPIESFNGIKAVCSENGATLVLVSSKYAYSQNIQGTMALPNMSTSTTSGSVSSGGYYGTYQGTTTSSGTTYIPYSYDVARFDQTALYFVKTTRKFKLGIFTDDLTAEIRSKVGQNQGVIVRVVLKDSPAFRANLVNGDVIISVNGVTLRNIDHMTAIVESLPATGTLHIIVLRNGSDKSIDIEY